MTSPICPDCKRYSYHLKKCRHHPSNAVSTTNARWKHEQRHTGSDDIHPEFDDLPDVQPQDEPAPVRFWRQ